MDGKLLAQVCRDGIEQLNAGGFVCPSKVFSKIAKDSVKRKRDSILQQYKDKSEGVLRGAIPTARAGNC